MLFGGAGEALFLGTCGETATPRERSRPRGGRQTETRIMATCQLGLGLTRHSGSSPHPELAPHLLPQQRGRGTCGWAGVPSPRTGLRCQALAGKVPLGEHDPIQKLPHVLDSANRPPSTQFCCWPQTPLHVRETWPPSTNRPLHLAWTAQPQVPSCLSPLETGTEGGPVQSLGILLQYSCTTCWRGQSPGKDDTN